MKNNISIPQKGKKTIPIQYQQFLVLYNEQNSIYLEKKPPAGLWGGLWCLPSLDKEDCPLNFIRLNYDLSGEAPRQLMTFKHRFSHFHLEINALSIKIKTLGNILSEKQGQWFAKEQINSLGLARPTSKILFFHYNIFKALS